MLVSRRVLTDVPGIPGRRADISCQRTRDAYRQSRGERRQAFAEGVRPATRVGADAGKVLTYGLLLGKLWSDLTEPEYLRVYVGQLRQKIEVDVKRPQYVLTEMGIGYRLRAPD